MQCPRCHAENRESYRFCGECGFSFASPCASCGFLNEGSEKFCGGCGRSFTRVPRLAEPKLASPQSYTPKHLAQKILTSKLALEGERKHVTILFADLKGSMELLADRDPEDASKLLDPMLELMMEAVHRYEGTVNQVMGDGIMALFGAPVAHEDHAVRACYAALRMQERSKRYAETARRGHGVNMQIRVGLNSGEVLVRSIGSDLRMDYSAVGQTTHLAARMEQLASPGTILLTSSTLELVEGLVAVTALGPVPVKGLAEPVEVYEVMGAGPARTRLQATARRGLTRFVGRDAELEQLRRAQQRAATGRGQIAAIVGEAGVGKSRVVYEFTHSHRLQGWLVLEAASVSHGKATSYLPVIDLLRGYFKIHDRDDLREVQEKVTGKLLTVDRTLEPTLPALLALLDVPVEDAAWQALDPPQRRQRTLDAVKRLLLREAREQPLLVIFEDLHWIDGETQALLDGLVDHLGSSRLLLLITYRPDYQHAWGGRKSYNQMRLDVLPTESAGELLDALLGNDPALEPLKQLLVKRGNPFFLEEVVRTLDEAKVLRGDRGRYQLTQPVQSIQVPATVQLMLMARIDRLFPEDKRILQIASVVGKDVPFALLQEIAGYPEEALRRGLDHLQAAEFLYEAGLFPDLEYTFKHALTHEVTYGGLLQDRRRELHARIVNAIEALHRDRLGEQIERLAHHAHRGEMREKAVLYLRQAGLRAAARSALPDARTWFEEALRVLAALPTSPSSLEQAFEIRLELRPVLSLLGDYRRVLEHLREAETLAGQLSDDRRRGQVSAVLTNAHTHLGELDEAVVTGTRALQTATRLGDLNLRLLATTYLEHAHYYRGEYERAVALATDNLATLPTGSDHESFGATIPIAIYDRYWLVLSLAELGQFTEAARYEAEALRLTELTPHAITVGLVHEAAAWLHIFKGDWATARRLIEHGIATYRTGNIVLGLTFAVARSAWILAQVGEASEALARLRESEQLLERDAARGYFLPHTVAYPSLGRAALLLGQPHEARSLGNRALEYSLPFPGFAAHTFHLLGDIATHLDQFDAESGESHYRKALELAELHRMRPLVAHCHWGLSNLCQRTRRRQEAQIHLTTATTLYREMGMRFWLEQAEAKPNSM